MSKEGPPTAPEFLHIHLQDAEIAKVVGMVEEKDAAEIYCLYLYALQAAGEAVRHLPKDNPLSDCESLHAHPQAAGMEEKQQLTKIDGLYPEVLEAVGEAVHPSLAKHRG